MNWWDKGSARRNVCSVVDFFRPFLSWKPIEIVPYVIPRCIIECSYQVFEHNAPSLSLSFFFLYFFSYIIITIFDWFYDPRLLLHVFYFLALLSSSSCSPALFPPSFRVRVLPMNRLCCVFSFDWSVDSDFQLEKKNSVKEYLRF